MDDLRHHSDSYWFQVPRDILGLVERYVRPLDFYPALPIRGLKYPRDQKPQVARLRLISRVALFSRGSLVVEDLDRTNRLILRDGMEKQLIAYQLEQQIFCSEPVTEWDRLINMSSVDNPDPRLTNPKIYHVTASFYDTEERNQRANRFRKFYGSWYDHLSYLDGRGNAIRVIHNPATNKKELFISPIDISSCSATLPRDQGLLPLHCVSQTIFVFQDPISHTIYFHIHGKIYRYAQGELQLILRTRLRNFQRAWINLQGQIILVHDVFDQKVDHLSDVTAPFSPAWSVLQSQPRLIVSIYG